MEPLTLKTKFNELYGSDVPEEISVYFSPGMVNLIGEHTDYNGGYVFPCALDFGTSVAVRKNGKSVFRFATTNFEHKGEVKIDTEYRKIENYWYNYPLGVIAEFRKQNTEFEGLDFLFSGEIPNGAGLSSSASIETVTAFALDQIFNLRTDKMELVKLCQRAENNFVGVNCGIMDQFAVTMGKKDHALFLNCATLDYELVPIKMEGFSLVISNTNKRRGLADSKYNERRSECEQAVEDLSSDGRIENLSSLDYSTFIDKKELIKDPVVFNRAKHVISENKRVLDAIKALKSNNLELFGQLMNESHDSLRTDYEVTGNELDTLVDEARKIEGVLGSRMTGAGFGGCTITLIKDSAIEDFKLRVGKNYYDKTGLVADFYTANVGDGVKKVN
jgi:galactokinase